MNLSYKSALVQVLIVSATCFCCPGMFNALTSFAGGVSDPSVAFNGNAVLYITFALSGFASGGLVNIIGPKIALFIGTWGYVLYACSLFYLQKNHSTYIEIGPTGDNSTVTEYTNAGHGFFYGACAILGICAGLLWTAQGQMCMAYPTKDTKGLYFSIFWVIFNLGGTIGGFISFGTNYDSQGGSTSDGTYLAFIIIMAGGAFLALLLADPNTVVRNDGQLLKVEKLPDWKMEAVEVVKLFVSPKMLLLFPLFAYSNWFYTYHTYFNVAFFNSRTNGLCSAFYWGSQMAGAYVLGLYLDRPGQSKKAKAISSLIILTILTCLMWALGLWAQLHFNLKTKSKLNIDFKDNTKEFLPKFFLYVYYGFNDSICQVWSYWLMGQMSDDITVLGRYAGYFKAVQSGMAAVSWKLGGSEVDPLIQLIINWILAGFGLTGAFLSIIYYMDNQDGRESLISEYRKDSYKLAQTPDVVRSDSSSPRTLPK